jgi:hypothetical protein
MGKVKAVPSAAQYRESTPSGELRLTVLILR